MNRNVLVIDDDDLVLNMLNGVLKNDFEVKLASNYDQAILLIEEANQEFPVVFVDFNLSNGKDGIETASAIQKIAPNTKFLFITGEEFDIKRATKFIGPEFLFMKKPFNIMEVKQQAEALSLSWHRQKEAEAAKKCLKKQKELIINSANDGIIEVSLSENGILVHGNQSCYDMLGYREDEFSSLFFKDISFYCKENDISCEKLLESGIKKIEEDFFTKKNGKEIPVSYTIIPIISEENEKSAIIVFKDQSFAREYEKTLEENTYYWQNIFDSIEDIIIVFDERLNIIKMNKTANTMIPRDIVNEIKHYSLTEGRYNTSLETIVCDTLNKGKNHTIDSSLESTFPVLDGKYFIVSTYQVENPAGKKEVILTLRDITQRKNMEDRLRELSIKDSLTGLYNRRYFANALRVEHQRALRSESEYACIMLDLDFFKKVNDTYGHEFGDFVIKEFAILMKRELRTTDVIARFGGEEFIILLPDTDINGAIATANKILKSTRDHVFDNGCISKNNIRTSIGVAALSASDLENSNQIISIADSKLYEAKNAGRDQIKY